LPAASFRFHLAMDTLAVQLTVPPVGSVGDFHSLVSAPCRAHKQKDGAPAPSLVSTFSQTTFVFAHFAFTGMAQEKSARVNPANLGSIGTVPSPNEIGFA